MNERGFSAKKRMQLTGFKKRFGMNTTKMLETKKLLILPQKEANLPAGITAAFYLHFMSDKLQDFFRQIPSEETEGYTQQKHKWHPNHLRHQYTNKTEKIWA